MKIAVKDANIVIDLVNGDLLGTCLKLPYAFCTTEGVISQLEWEEQWSTVRPFVDAGALEIIELTTQEMEDIFASPLLMKLDVVDLGVMHLAKRENAILLTGDLALRKESAQWGIRVHGKQPTEPALCRKAFAAYSGSKCLPPSKGGLIGLQPGLYSKITLLNCGAPATGTIQ